MFLVRDNVPLSNSVHTLVKSSKIIISDLVFWKRLSTLILAELEHLLTPVHLTPDQQEYKYYRNRLKYPSDETIKWFIKLGIVLKRLKYVEPLKLVAQFLRKSYRKLWRTGKRKSSICQKDLKLNLVNFVSVDHLELSQLDILPHYLGKLSHIPIIGA